MTENNTPTTESERKSSPTWIGPVAAAVILVGGYIGYDQWREHDRHQQMCADLKHQFQSNMSAMAGPVADAMQRSRKDGSQLPMLDVSGSVSANKVVLDQLEAECPGWIEADYD